MGVWDAMGQGVQAGVNAWLEGRRQRQEQGESQRNYDLLKDARFQADQEKRQGQYAKLSDFSDPAKGIFVYEYDELSPGAYVPVPREEQLSRYQKQKAEWDQSEAAKSQLEYTRDYSIAKLRGGGEGGATKTPDDTQTLLQQLYGKDGRLNTAIATSLFTRMLQAQLPPGMPVNPVDLLRGQEGVRRAQDIATYLGSAASSYHQGRDVRGDLLTFLATMSPDLATALKPPPPTVPPPAPAPMAPGWGGGAPAVNELKLPLGYQVTGSSALGVPGGQRQAMEVKDARGRTMYWDDLSGAWLYKE
jgi:hypothetical protein